MVECPRCGGKGVYANKEWNYAIFHVKLFNCLNCKRTFNAYFRRNDRLSHTIPKGR